MKKNEVAHSLLLNFHCNYYFLVLEHWNTIPIVHYYRNFKLLKNLSYPFIIKGDLKEKGSKFILRRPDLGTIIFYEIIEKLVTDYYSRFKFSIYRTIPETLSYIHQIEIRYINEDECDFRTSLTYNNRVFFSEKEFKYFLQLMKGLYKIIEMSSKKFQKSELSVVYTLINQKIEFVWNILKNTKMIHKYVNLIADQINYNGNTIHKNDTIELIDCRNKFKSKAKVNKCKHTKMDLTEECILELLFQRNNKNFNSLSFSKIVVRINEYNGQSSMYIFYYFFCRQNSDVIKNFTEKKNKELTKFKYIVENYKYHFSNSDEIPYSK